jgi:hypothetical protein
MFARILEVKLQGPLGSRAAPLAHMDSFAMRGFTGESRFDATLPRADGIMEAGLEVPLSALQLAVEDWFRRKGYLQAGESVVLAECPRPRPEQPLRPPQ